jgi:hypothetical protein
VGSVQHALLYKQQTSPTAPDGGTREGNETQITPTLTTIAASAQSWLDRGFNEGRVQQLNCENNCTGSFSYGFTQPSLWKYDREQWLWDSGAAAITNAWHNTSRAALELRTIVRAQQPDGRIPEQVSWPAGTGNHKTQMPVLPWTLRAIHNRTGDAALLRELVPPLVRYWNWWRTTRDIDGNGLVTILHPWESGIDISPAYDAAWHVHNPTPPARAWPTIYPLLDELQHVYQTRYGWNQTAILARQHAEPSVLANWFMVQVSSPFCVPYRMSVSWI